MSLTNTTIRNVRAARKTTKLFDERGLYLEVSPTGGKRWRLKYRYESKEKRLSLGVFPDVSHFADCSPDMLSASGSSLAGWRRQRS
jgi:hypothetical protein